METILVDVEFEEVRIAILDENQALTQYYVEKKDSARILNNVYLGKVVDILPGMQAAFVDIGREKNAYLHIKDALISEEENKGQTIEKLLNKGQGIIVQVIKEEIGDKGAKITRKVGLPGRNIVLLPFEQGIGISRSIRNQEIRKRLKSEVKKYLSEDYGLIVRTAAKDYSGKDFAEEIEYLIKMWEDVKRVGSYEYPPKLIFEEWGIAHKVLRDYFTDDVKTLYINLKEEYDKSISLMKKLNPDLLNRMKHYQDKVPMFLKFNIISQLEQIYKPRVWLKSGGYIVIDHTEALTAIDVNTGKYTGKREFEETIFQLNLEASKEIAKQLKLRDISGIIIIDFIDMKSGSHYKELIDTFEKYLHHDKTKTKVLGVTNLGLLELTRKRESKTLEKYLYSGCDHCEGTGRRMSLDFFLLKVEKEVLRKIEHTSCKEFFFKVHPDLNKKLRRKPERIKKMEAYYQITIYFKGDENLAFGDFEIHRNTH
ncbi:Rne/Rng family ribonuclease [Isachenkonia alkalipeptolytica]|uniref:Rne/Rng family ribonuclease n=1 Tax=Isachenkonia alkalipeptolytica TaxID=2565777 RepID=A0AA44BFY0_9CLOT|nr:Rne/Rng family ribonuclease [Isachenkonia alkalipeptolytica]NBG88946.1 Rne/Rng family ribonuclease [Isachenkonia alkalipeptolytica]